MKSCSVLVAIESVLLRQDVSYLLTNSGLTSNIAEEDPSNWKNVLNRVDRERPEILIIELNAIKGDLTQALRSVKKLAPQIQIICLHPTDDAQTILSAMRAGANEFIHPPYSETFMPAVERMIESYNAEQYAERRGKVIGFLSAKGGCGSTTLACHIASDLRRMTGKRVLLADLDLTSGMVGFLMKVTSRYSILDAVANLGRLDESLWKALLAEYKPGIDVIPSPEGFSHEVSPSPDELRQVIRFMRTQHDWVVLDLGRSLNEHAAALYAELDELLLVSVLEVSALHGLKTIVQKLRDRGEDLTKLELVLNRTPKMMDMTQDDLQKVLGRPLYALLPNDYQSLYEAYSAGTLLPPQNRLAHQFASLTAKLAGIETPKQQKKFALFR